MWVALRKESVDRNRVGGVVNPHLAMSLSARRAWIEIFSVPHDLYTTYVALRKESVDRNISVGYSGLSSRSSLSARRAWIEILLRVIFTVVVMSLSARRAWIEISARRPATAAR